VFSSNWKNIKNRRGEGGGGPNIVEKTHMCIMHGVHTSVNIKHEKYCVKSCKFISNRVKQCKCKKIHLYGFTQQCKIM